MAMQVVVETGEDHAAICFADGVQMATGCTFGKGLIKRTDYGKWALILIDKASERAVRVSVNPGVIEMALQSKFVKMRHKGILATEVPIDISRPLVEELLSKPTENLFTVSEIFNYSIPKQNSGSQCSVVRCRKCGEGVAGNLACFDDNQPICIPCASGNNYE